MNARFIYTAIGFLSSFMGLPITSSAQDAGQQSRSAQVLREEWLFQADGSPDMDRTIAELLWTEQLAARIQTRQAPPDLSMDLAALKAIREKSLP